jgi:hypothetical protein
MSQYTNKINQIAEEFAEMEYYEQPTALEGRNGMLIMHYQHGGKHIEFTRNSEYEGVEGRKGETIDIPPYDDRYLQLMEKYNHGTSWAEHIAKWWKDVANIKFKRVNFFKDK